MRDEEIDTSWAWAQLISDVANKAGAHMDDERPVSWDKVGQHEVMGVPVIPRLLYRFGQVIAQCGSELLVRIGEEELDPSALTASLGGGTVFEVSVQNGDPPNT